MTEFPPLETVIAETVAWMRANWRVSHIECKPRLTSGAGDSISYHCNMTVETSVDGAHRTEYFFNCSFVCLQEAILTSRLEVDAFLRAMLPRITQKDAIFTRRDVLEAELERVTAERDHARAVLKRLVDAKDEKDAWGETDRYRELKAGAWERARELVARSDQTEAP